MAEEWRSVVGYEGLYEVSSFGGVRSVDREVVKSNGVVQSRRGKTKSIRKNSDGYSTVKLSKGGVDKTFMVHRLVAQAFIRHDIEDLEIDHIDFDRSNNCVDNLAVVDHTENIRRSKRFGRHISCRDRRGGNNPNYGNRKLSDKYKEDPLLSKQNQSRPGGKNGRARGVIAIKGGNSRKFDCLTDCANFLISTNAVRGKRSYSIATSIRMAAESGASYGGYSYEFV